MLLEMMSQCHFYSNSKDKCGSTNLSIKRNKVDSTSFVVVIYKWFYMLIHV